MLCLSGTNNFLDGIEEWLKTTLNTYSEKAHEGYDSGVKFLTRKLAPPILAYLQAKGLIKNFKLKSLSDKVEVQKEQIRTLEGKDHNYEQAQMEIHIRNLQTLFDGENINFKLPDLPANCTSMEEYSEIVKININIANEKHPISKDDKIKIDTILDIYRNSIESISKELKLGKASTLERN